MHLSLVRETARLDTHLDESLLLFIPRLLLFLGSLQFPLHIPFGCRWRGSKRVVVRRLILHIGQASLQNRRRRIFLEPGRGYPKRR